MVSNLFYVFELIIWTVVITAATAHKVFESTEDIGPEAFQNITTLYPVNHNNTFNRSTNIKFKYVDNNQTADIENDARVTVNDTNIKEEKPKIDATVWKIEAAFADSNLEDKHEKEKVTEDDKKNDIKEFKPSQHLGNFYDEDNFQIIPTKASFESFTPAKEPSSGFVSSSDEFRSPFREIPKSILETHKQYPYKFETPVLTRLKNSWVPERPDIIESRPTVEIPVSIPAGGFYKYEDPFREKPGFPVKGDEDPFRDIPGSNEEDFGLSFTEDGKDNDSAIKKRVNPWENFLRLVTAFLPVGLIISALTPSIVTIENTGQGRPYPSTLLRRSEPATSSLPVISERCRRRLLCELHSDKNYKNEKSLRRGKQCYKIHCEDTEALARTLRWLLEYRRTQKRQDSTLTTT